MKQKVVICGVDTSRLKRLSVKESEELLGKIKEGDKTARDEFILANIRLVLSIIRRFDKSKVSADDMFQAGMIGLIKSVDNFDLSVGVRFSTYAVPMNFVCRNVATKQFTYFDKNLSEAAFPRGFVLHLKANNRYS